MLYRFHTLSNSVIKGLRRGCSTRQSSNDVQYLILRLALLLGYIVSTCSQQVGCIIDNRLASKDPYLHCENASTAR